MAKAASPALCMSCGGDFPFGPGDPCTKCSKIEAAGSESEKQAVMVSDNKILHFL
jgi:hypothetical protein